MSILYGTSLKNCVFQCFASLGCLGGSWGDPRGSWGRLGACWGCLGGGSGEGFDALEPLREFLGSGLGSLIDF